MDLGFLASFGIWTFVINHPGIILVAAAVGLEVACEWNDEKSVRERLKKFAGIMVVAGLLLEIAEALKQDKDVARLESRTADVETTNALLWQTNMVLRSNIITLELKMEPRVITPEQVTNFIFLTENIKKIPITVSIGQEGFDTEGFAVQLRNMLSVAGFGTNEGGVWGIKRDTTRLLAITNAQANHGFDILLVVPSQEFVGYIHTNRFSVENVNGFNKPINCGTNELDVYNAISFVLSEIGIKFSINSYSGWAGTSVFELYIPMKNQF